MYHRDSTGDLKPLKLAKQSKTILKENLPLLEYESTVAEEVISFRFMNGTIHWLDIISSITNGKAPFLVSYHPSVFSPESQVRLESIMGCRNGVMLQVGRISALYKHQIQLTEQVNLDCSALGPVVLDIDSEIQRELSQLALEDPTLLEDDLDMLADISTFVTQMFAYMASIYLHLIIYGFSGQNMLAISAYAKAMDILRAKIPRTALPALVCPLFIIGSVAKTEDEQYFRNVFSLAPISGSIYQQRERILPILENIWSMRKSKPTVTWKECLYLTQNILLL